MNTDIESSTWPVSDRQDAFGNSTSKLRGDVAHVHESSNRQQNLLRGRTNELDAALMGARTKTEQACAGTHNRERNITLGAEQALERVRSDTQKAQQLWYAQYNSNRNYERRDCWKTDSDWNTTSNRIADVGGDMRWGFAPQEEIRPDTIPSSALMSVITIAIADHPQYVEWGFEVSRKKPYRGSAYIIFRTGSWWEFSTRVKKRGP